MDLGYARVSTASSWIRFSVSRTVRPRRSRVHHDHVTLARILEHLAQPGPIDRRTGLLVEIDPLGRHTSRGQRVDLAIEVLLIRYDPRDLAEIRVFHDDRFLTRALCPELAGRTIAIKDLAAARNARRRDLARGIRERDSLVDRLVDVHRPDYNAQPPAAPDEPPAASEPARRLKRYREE